MNTSISPLNSAKVYAEGSLYKIQQPKNVFLVEILDVTNVMTIQLTTARTVPPGCSTSSHLTPTVSVCLGTLKVVQLVRAVAQLVLVVPTAAMMMELMEPFPLIFLFLSVKTVMKLLDTTTMSFPNSAVPSVEMGLL